MSCFNSDLSFLAKCVIVWQLPCFQALGIQMVWIPPNSLICYCLDAYDFLGWRWSSFQGPQPGEWCQLHGMGPMFSCNVPIYFVVNPLLSWHCHLANKGWVDHAASIGIRSNVHQHACHCDVLDCHALLPCSWFVVFLVCALFDAVLVTNKISYYWYAWPFGPKGHKKC